MKQSFETSKLYYGFPIFILGYQDQTYGYNVTTCSSSYSLGDWLVFGVGSKGNAADQIKHYQKFTVNIPDESFILQLEQAGFISHREKIAELCLDFRPSKLTQALSWMPAQSFWIVRSTELLRKMVPAISLLRF